MTINKKLYAIMSTGSTIGMVAAFWQTLEKLSLIKNQTAPLSCNLSSVFSCSNVLRAHQASVFGFPNSIMCLTLFTIFFAVALVGLTGGKVGAGMRLGVEALSLLTLGFAFWFLFQSTYRIGAICIFCLTCFAGLLMINAAWLRLNARDLPLRNGKYQWMNLQISRGADIFMWLLMALLLAGAIIFRFYV